MDEHEEVESYPLVGSDGVGAAREGSPRKQGRDGADGARRRLWACGRGTARL